MGPKRPNRDTMTDACWGLCTVEGVDIGKWIVGKSDNPTHDATARDAYHGKVAGPGPPAITVPGSENKARSLRRPAVPRSVGAGRQAAAYAASGMRAMTLISKSKPASQVTPIAVQLG
jgi:hypothetical protein